MIKKICILVIALLGMVSAVSADNVKIPVRDFNLSISADAVRHYLGADREQRDEFEFIFDELSRDMRFASTMETEQSQNMVTSMALQKNLQLIAPVLDRDQYRKYLRILNVTLVNKGFSIPDIVVR